MMRQKRNLSAFRQYQENSSRIFDEDSIIADYSDDENAENSSSCNITTTCNKINSNNNNNETSKSSFYYTPPPKRIKRIPLSAVRHKPLQIQRPRRRSCHDGTTSQYFNMQFSLRTLKAHNITCDFNDEDNNEQELTIEWSSSSSSEDSTDNTTILTSKTKTRETKLAEKQIPTLSQCTQSSAWNSAALKANPFKRCRRGGYLHQFQQTMKQFNADRKFLEHDKKFGLRQYNSLRVLKIEISFGVHLATVASACDEIFQIVLHNDMAENVTLGSTLESFMETNESYEIESCDGVKNVVIQPSKFLQS